MTALQREHAITGYHYSPATSTRQGGEKQGYKPAVAMHLSISETQRDLPLTLAVGATNI
jgi:hypothetical protein